MSEIFAYWNNRNGSKSYSKKLFGFFIEQGNLLVRFPLHGREIGVKDLRSVVFRDYELVYELVPDGVRVVAVWNTRQNPKKLHELLKKTFDTMRKTISESDSLTVYELSEEEEAAVLEAKEQCAQGRVLSDEEVREKNARWLK